MLEQLLPALRITAVLTLLTGVIYPLVVTGVAQALFSHQANGSLIVENGRVVGSELIGQSFTRPGYFQGRPSAAGNGYDASASSGSNLGPTSRKLIERVAADTAAYRKNNPVHTGFIPPDAVTTSGSGLDPHISPANAAAQAFRVAKARNLPIGKVLATVNAHTEGRDLGFLGEPRVNVLLVNRQLDRIAPVK